MKLKLSSRLNSPRSAFTLIELLVVIAIIAILASLILGVSGFVQEKAGIARAETEIKALETALESYKQDMGGYPEGNGDEKSTLALLDALNPKGVNDLNPSNKVYYEMSARMMDTYSSKKSTTDIRNTAKKLVDPFGNPYRYFFSVTGAQNSVTGSQNNGPQFFDLWSFGKNADKNEKQKLQAAWIKNW